MKRAFYTLFFISFMSICSCGKHKIINEINSFTDTNIIFPANMLYYPGEKNMNIKNYRPKIVFWYDSTECVQCKMHNVDDFFRFESEINDTLDKVDVIIIFSPDYATLKLNLLATNIMPLHYYPIYIDTANMFANLNPCIPENKLMHSFLLDATNRVVLVGNPIQNQAMFDLYKKTIDEMLN